jgi:hypothetical protein
VGGRDRLLPEEVDLHLASIVHLKQALDREPTVEGELATRPEEHESIGDAGLWTGHGLLPLQACDR